MYCNCSEKMIANKTGLVLAGNERMKNVAVVHLVVAGVVTVCCFCCCFCLFSFIALFPADTKQQQQQQQKWCKNNCAVENSETLVESSETATFSLSCLCCDRCDDWSLQQQQQ